METTAWWDKCYQDPDAEAFGPPSTEVVALASQQSGRERVLDIGCGEGRNCLPFIERGCKVFALDLSIPALAKFNRRSRSSGASIHLWAQDFRDGLPAGQFDVVLCHGVLHFFPPTQRDSLLWQIKAATLPGGYAVIAAFNNMLPPPNDMAPLLKGLFDPERLRMSFAEWEVVLWRSYTFEDSHPGGVHHIHSIDKIVARKQMEVR